MIAFAAMLEAAARDPAALDAYLAKASPRDRAAAEALLSGQRPRRVARLDALVRWAGEAAGMPDWLVQAALAVSGDRAEVAALVLPDPSGEAPGLAEVVDRLNRCTAITAHATLAALWARLPPRAAVVVNRLASGTFRATRTASRQAAAPGQGGLVRAVMVQAEPARRAITLALWRGNGLVPMARVALTLAEAPAILDWVRAKATERFGPVRLVPAMQVFEVACDGLIPNRRRKCGFDLVNPALTAWLVGLDAGQADGVDRLARMFASQGPDPDQDA